MVQFGRRWANVARMRSLDWVLGVWEGGLGGGNDGKTSNWINSTTSSFVEQKSSPQLNTQFPFPDDYQRIPRRSSSYIMCNSCHNAIGGFSSKGIIM